MSKRKLLQLVERKHVRGWDDPRMPTISGLRRRGFTPESIRDFCARVGVAKKENVIDVGLLEHCVREDLNRRAPRAMAVLRPLKLVLTNYPEGQSEAHDGRQPPRRSVGGHAPGAVLARDLHRARRLHGDAAEEVLPPLARARSAAAQRLPRDLHGGREGRVGADRRAARHLRSGHARRRRAGRAQGQGDAALGVGRARGRRRSAALRSAVHRRKIRTARRRDPTPTSRRCSIRARSRPCRAARSSRCSAPPPPAAAINSSVSVISPSIRTAGPARRSSTAPSRSKIRGPKSPDTRRLGPMIPIAPGVRLGPLPDSLEARRRRDGGSVPGRRSATGPARRHQAAAAGRQGRSNRRASA